MLTLTKTQARALVSMTPKAGQDRARPYLVGVYVDPKGYAVATDGRAMLVARVHLNPAPSDGITIPRDALESAIRMTPNRGVIAIELVPDGIRLHAGGVATVTKPVAGKFPDWRRVLSNTMTGEPAGYDPEVLKRAVDAVTLYSGGKGQPLLTTNGDREGLVWSPGADAFAIIMPMRNALGDAEAAGECLRRVLS